MDSMNNDDTYDIQQQPTRSASNSWIYLRVLGCALSTAMMGGVVFGYAALEPVLISEGAYLSRCSDQDHGPRGGAGADHEHSGSAACANQQLALDLMYTVAIFSLSACMLVWGHVLDRFGPRRTMVVGVLLQVCGFIMLGALRWYLASFFVLGGASTCVFMACMTVSKCDPSLSSKVTAILIGVFDSSAAVFYLMSLLYDRTALSFRVIIIGYSVFCLIVGLLTVFALPHQDHIAAIQEDYDAFHNNMQGTKSDDVESVLHQPVLGDAGIHVRDCDSSSLLLDERHHPLLHDGLSPPPDRTSAWTYVKGRPYIFLTMFLCILNLKNAFFVQSFVQQMDVVAHHQNSSAAALSRVKSFFYIVFPAGGFLSMPVTGWMLHKFHGSDYNIFGIVNFLALAHAITNLMMNFVGQYVAIVIYSILRSMKWASFTEFVNKHYPLQHIGRLLGTTNVIVAVFGLLLYPLDAISSKHFNGDYTQVNVALTICEVLTLAFPLWLYAQRDKIQKMRQDDIDGVSS